MSLKETINNEIKEAMKAKDAIALKALRAIKSAIILAETSEGRTQAELSPDEEMKLLAKQAKQRKDSSEQFRNAGRDDLAISEDEELRVIERFLPKALSAEELEAEVKKIIVANGASGMKDMGRVMGEASKALAGRVDGKALSDTVKKLLS